MIESLLQIQSAVDPAADLRFGERSAKSSPSERTHRSEAKKEKPDPPITSSVRDTDPTPSRSKPSLLFKVDDQSGQTLIQLIDEESGEVIRQIPPEELLEIAETMEKLRGHAVDTVA